MFGKKELPDGLPVLKTYEAVAARYEATKPISKGYDAGLVPLGDNRRYKRSQIVKVETLHGAEYRLRYWDTDVFTFRPNGAILVDVEHWATPTTAMFLNGVSEDQFCLYKKKIYFKEHATGRHFRVFPNESLEVRTDPTVWGWVAVNPRAEHAYVVNRKRMKEKKEQFKPFINYITDMASIENVMTSEELFDQYRKARGAREGIFNESKLTTSRVKGIPNLAKEQMRGMYRENAHNNRLAFFNMVDKACRETDLELLYALYMLLHANSADSTWGNGRMLFTNSPDNIKNYLFELMKYTFNDVFDMEEQPLGTRVADTNAKYIYQP